MSFISVNELKPGMVLLSDVVDVNGRLLLPEGKTIEDQHLRIFKMWGVTDVNVKGEHDAGSGAGADEAQLEAAKRYCIPFFRRVDMNHPAMRELFRQSVLYNSRKGNFDVVRINLPDSKEDKPCKQISDWRSYLSKSNIKLPETPGMVDELNEVISNPFAVADDIANIVNKSPSLAATLLKIVNSAFYGFPSRIDGISRAVTLIGTREIKSLALGISVMNSFKGINNDFLNMNEFIMHSIACGVVARILAAQANIPQTEQMFVSGLLHDVGRLLIYKYFPDHTVRMFRSAGESGQALIKSEKDALGVRHTRMGSFLLEKWKLPPMIVNNVLYHHTPSSASEFSQAALVHLADVIVNALGIGSSGERGIAVFDANAWDRLGLSVNIFENIIRQATHQLKVFDAIIE